MCTPKSSIVYVNNMKNGNGVTNISAAKSLSKLYRKHSKELGSLDQNRSS